MYWLVLLPGPDPIREMLVVELRWTTTIRWLYESLTYKTSLLVIDIPKGILSWSRDDPLVPLGDPVIVTPLWFQEAWGERLISAKEKHKIISMIFIKSVLYNKSTIPLTRSQRKNRKFYACWSWMECLYTGCVKMFFQGGIHIISKSRPNEFYTKWKLVKNGI